MKSANKAPLTNEKDYSRVSNAPVSAMKATNLFASVATPMTKEIRNKSAVRPASPPSDDDTSETVMVLSIHSIIMCSSLIVNEYVYLNNLGIARAD